MRRIPDRVDPMPHPLTVSFALCLAGLAVSPWLDAQQDLLRVDSGTVHGEVAGAGGVWRDVEIEGKQYRLHGVSHPIEISTSGHYTIDARSYFFDTYLILRDADGERLVEDDNGGLRTHSRIRCRLEGAARYSVDVLAWDDRVGRYDVSLRPGPGGPVTDPEALQDAELEDAREELRVRDRAYVWGHPDVAQSLDGLANHLASLGREDQALPFYLRALELRQQLFPGDGSDVARSLHALALCLDSVGHAAEALPHHRQALAMRQRLFPYDHSSVADTLNDLAGCLISLDRSEEAMPLLLQALEIRRRLYPEDDPAVALSLHNLGRCLESRARPSEALPYLREALEMRQRLFPGDHTDVLISLNNLAQTLESLGRRADALPLYQEALESGRRLFSEDDLAIAIVLNNLAICLDALGRPAEALPSAQLALEMSRRLLPEGHPQVANFASSLAACLDSLGRGNEALALYRQTLEVRQRLYASNHADIALSLNNVGSCFCQLGCPAEALPLLRRAVESLEQSSTDNWRIVAPVRSNLARCLVSLGRLDEALLIFQSALDVRQRVLSADHPDVATSLNNCGYCLILLDRAAEALPMLQHALLLRQRVLTDYHPDAVESLHNLAWAFCLSGRRSEALSLAIEEVRIIESLRHRAFRLDRETRGMYFGELKRGRPYDFISWLYLLQGNAAAGLRYAERGRARELLDTLEESRFDPVAKAIRQIRASSGLDEEAHIATMQDQLRDTALEVARLEHAVANLMSDGKLAADERKLRQAEIRNEMLTAYDRRRVALQEERRILADVLPGAKPADPEEIQALVGQGELLLFFALDDEHPHLFVVPPAPEPIEAIELATKRSEFEREALKLLRALSHGQVIEEDRGPGGLEDDEQDASAIAASLANSLLPGKLWSRIRACSRIWLIPDGPLHRIPFEALVVGRDGDKPVYWLDDGPPIAYAPSGSVLRWVRERARTQRDRQPKLDLVAFGDPAFLQAEARPVPEQGALIVQVHERSEAARVGLRPLDVLISYDARPIADDAVLKQGQRAVQDAIEAKERSTDPVRVAVWRQEAQTELEFDVRPGELGIDVGRGPAHAAYEAWERNSVEVFQRDAQLERFGELKRLPGTRREVAAAASAFPKDRVMTRFDREATEAGVFEQAPAAKYLHFATHGLVQQYAGQSFCALALAMPVVPTELDNGFLTLEDLMTRWRDRIYGCRMVVMSACRTAVGRLQRDEAMHALPVGFFYAGASSVVGSLWNVNDSSTAELMSDFYRRLAEAEKDGRIVDRLRLLHESKRELKRKHPDPFHWAPFLYIGSPE